MVRSRSDVHRGTRDRAAAAHASWRRHRRRRTDAGLGAAFDPSRAVECSRRRAGQKQNSNQISRSECCMMSSVSSDHEFRGWTDRHPLDRWRIAKTVASELLRSHFRTIRLPMSLADGMANLLAADANWQVADPACGIGTLLLSVGDRGFRRDSPVLLFGTDRDNRLVEIARELVRFAGADLNVIPARNVRRRTDRPYMAESRSGRLAGKGPNDSSCLRPLGPETRT